MTITAHVRARSAALLLLALAAAIPSRARSQGLPADFDAYVARALREFDVPGAGVAVVKDGRLVLARGYGVRRLGEATPVDGATLFAIASNTKAFTAAALATLVDAGKLTWDTPVREVMPSFALYDPYVTHEITIRDLLSHRSGLGLGGGDLLWLGSNYTREEVVQRIRYLPPASSLRSRYAYQNVMFVAAGQVIPAVTGRSWDDYVRETLLQPLGMMSSNTSVRKLVPGMNYATPHSRIGGRLTVVSWDTVDNIGPAGGINSSAADMARWLMAQLDSGRVPGGRLWSVQRTRELWSPATIVPIGRYPAELREYEPMFQAYALGLNVRDYRGQQILLHSGGLQGMVSQVVMVPALRLGVVVLSNAEESLPLAVALHALDGWLGGATDWIAALKSVAAAEHARADSVSRRQAAERHAEVGPSLELAHYSGRYRDAMYGDATIEIEGGKAVLRFSRSPGFVADLEHWQYDSFVAHWRDRGIPEAFVTFALTPGGTVESFRMAAVSPAADFSFDYQDLLFRPVGRAAPAAR
jgi:CubicO group peptidase (beta-lactamase class C family)